MNLLGVIFFTKDLIAWSFYRNHEMIRSQMLRLSQVHFTWDVGTRRARFRCDVDIVLVHRISSSDFDLHVAELHWEWLFSQPLLPGDTNVSFLALHPVLVWLGHIQSNTGGEFNRWKQQTTFGRNLGNGGMRESENSFGHAVGVLTTVSSQAFFSTHASGNLHVSFTWCTLAVFKIVFSE